MNERVNPFAEFEEKLESLKTTARPANRVEQAMIDVIAEENNFPSRDAPKASKPPKRRRRVYKTGRNQNLHVKVTVETSTAFYRIVNEQEMVMGELMRLALEAF